MDLYPDPDAVGATGPYYNLTTAPRAVELQSAAQAEGKHYFPLPSPSQAK